MTSDEILRNHISVYCSMAIKRSFPPAVDKKKYRDKIWMKYKVKDLKQLVLNEMFL